MSEMLDTLNIAAAAIAKAQALELARPISVPAGQSVQAALDAAPAGAVLQLDTATYPGSLRYTKPVTLTTRQVLATGRVDPTRLGSWLVGDVGTDAHTVLADDVTLLGIGTKSQDATRQLLAVTGKRFAAKQIALLGDPTRGQHRGLMAHGDTGSLIDSFIDECWLAGRDAQAIGAWMDGKHWVFTNNYLGGGAEIVLLGGADAPDATRIPQDFTFSGNLLSKRLNWFTNGAQCKNGLETKCIDGLVFTDNIVEYAGHEQGGYPLVLKSCNQDGHAPWSVTQNVRIERNVFRHGGGGASFVGMDGSNLAIRMNHVVLRNNIFDAIDPTVAPGGGDGRGFIFQSAVDHLTLDSNTLAAAHMSTEMYFIGPAPTALVITNLKGILPKTSLYGVKVEGVGYGLDKVQVFAPDAVLQITASDPGASGYPVAA